jgi:hypothetical protein
MQNDVRMSKFRMVAAQDRLLLPILKLPVSAHFFFGFIKLLTTPGLRRIATDDNSRSVYQLLLDHRQQWNTGD